MGQIAICPHSHERGIPMPAPPLQRPIHKKIVTDEHHRPVAVQIDYEDWLQIEQRLGLAADDPHRPGGNVEDDALNQLLSETSGIWSAGDGLEYQRRIRAEWDRPWDTETREGT